jgi:Flp pilus assembly protein TadD
MSPKQLLPVGLLILASPIVSQAQVALRAGQIKIIIPRHSELTPVQRLNREGVDAVAGRHYEKAEGLFYKAYLYDSADPFTLNNLGYVSELQGQVDRAEDFYKLAVAQDCYAIIDRSSAKELKGKPMMDALGTLKDIPMRVNRINILGIQLLSQGRVFEAEAVFQSAVVLDPTNPFTLNNLGVAEESIGDLDSALKYYDEAAASHSKQMVVVTLKHSLRGKPVSEMAAKSARDLRIRIQARTPAQIRAAMLTFQGVTVTNKNDWRAARQSFTEAYALDPDSAFALNNIGYIAERDGDLETARSYYARALRADDGKARVGLATKTSAQGLRIAAVAEQSHVNVDAELAATIESRRSEKRPVVLIPRNVDADQPDPSPATRAPDKNVPDPSTQQPPQ